jgi:cell division protein FtsZ
MENSGSALMGIGRASGEHRATEAATEAINSPLLDVSITGARGVLFSIAGGDDLTMFEIQDAAKTITESVDPQAKIIFGTIHDDKLKKGEIKITVIASGFPANAQEGEPGAAVRNMFPNQEVQEEVVPVQTQAPGKIFNSIPAEQPPQEAPAKVEEKDEDDDWGAVPAFLRRSKLK